MTVRKSNTATRPLGILVSPLASHLLILLVGLLLTSGERSSRISSRPDGMDGEGCLATEARKVGAHITWRNLVV